VVAHSLPSDTPHARPVDPIVITWRELLIAVIAVLAVYAAELLLLLRFGRQPRLPFRTRARPDPDVQPYALGNLREEVAELRRTVATLRAEIESLQKRSPRSGQTASSPYAQAIQLARDGGDAAVLARDCGISRGEAELIVALHSTRH
jgi:hypothetical protein